MSIRWWESLLPLGGFVVEEQHYPLPSLQDGPSSDIKVCPKECPRYTADSNSLELARRFGDGIDWARALERKVLSFGNLPFGNKRVETYFPLRMVGMSVCLGMLRSHTPPRRQVGSFELAAQIRLSCIALWERFDKWASKSVYVDPGALWELSSGREISPNAWRRGRYRDIRIIDFHCLRPLQRLVCRAKIRRRGRDLTFTILLGMILINWLHGIYLFKAFIKLRKKIQYRKLNQQPLFWLHLLWTNW